MNRPKIIGLTGGIGSGKTTVAKHFESLGVAVYISDEEAKKITNSPEILSLIKNEFGQNIFDANVLDRKKLGAIVFNDAKKLEILNSFIHPAVKLHFKDWLLKHKNEKFVIKESAILIETGEYKNCDVVVSVIASLENRIERLKNRDDLSENEIMIRINNQISDEERMGKSDFIINNDILSMSKMQVETIFRQFSIKYSNKL